MSKEDKGVVSDLGILASGDPLSIDKASVDLLNKRNNDDVFSSMWELDHNTQFEYAAKMGLGSLDYDLKKIDL